MTFLRISLACAAGLFLSGCFEATPITQASHPMTAEIAFQGTGMHAARFENNEVVCYQLDQGFWCYHKEAPCSAQK